MAKNNAPPIIKTSHVEPALAGWKWVFEMLNHEPLLFPDELTTIAHDK